MEFEKIGNCKAAELGLVAIGVVISHSVESLVALPHLSRDFLFFGGRSAALPGRLKLTHYRNHRQQDKFGTWCLRGRIALPRKA
jgi:hypothetical protein